MPVATDSVVAGESVHVLEVEVQGEVRDPEGAGPKPVIDVVDVLTPGEDYIATTSAADINNLGIVVIPTAPLAADTTYLVVATDGIREQGGEAFSPTEEYALMRGEDPLVDGDGNSQVPGLSDAEAQALEQQRQLVQTHLGAAGNAAQVDAGTVIASWTFTTQTFDPVMQAVAGAAQAAGADLDAILEDTQAPTPNEAATIHAGVLQGFPYYSSPAEDDKDTAPLNEFWRTSDGDNVTGMEPQPAMQAGIGVPVLVTVPAGEDACAEGCPVVVFQHGITGDRSNALAIADALASAPVPHVVVAIDMPLHGITDPDSPLYTVHPETGETLERTFDLDLLNTGGIDPSGEHFIQLGNLRGSRDNLRQAAADLLALVNGGIEAVDEGLGEDINLVTAEVGFVGQSLGGMVGAPFLEYAGGRVNQAVLAAPGGHVAKLLDGSPAFGPSIEAGLRAQGLDKGSPEYEQFLAAAQTVIDPVEPHNFAAGAVTEANVLMLQIIGGAASPPDQVIPNNLVEPLPQGTPEGTIPSPTAGTDPLAAVMGLEQIGGAEPSAPGTDTIVRFTAGSHGSLLDPGPDGAVTAEMQQLMVTFLLSGVTNVENADVVAD